MAKQFRPRHVVTKTNGTGAQAIATSATVPAGGTYQLISVSCKFSSAPTTSENVTITLDANAGAAYDVVLYSVDPSASSLTTIFWQPDQPIYLEAGDVVVVAYTNTDTRTYGVQITTVGV